MNRRFLLKPKVSIIKDKIMTIGKSNRMNTYMKEIEEIEREYLQKHFGLSPLQRKFYEHRKSLLEDLIGKYINSSDGN